MSCSYAAPRNRKSAPPAGSSRNSWDMQQRINRLEEMVLSLMTHGIGSQDGATTAAQHMINSGPDQRSSTAGLGEHGGDTLPGATVNGQEEESEAEQMSQGIGIMNMVNGRSMFASDSHWCGLLAEIGEFKKWFEAHKDDFNQDLKRVEAAKAEGTTLFSPGLAGKDKHELLEAFPQKAEADLLIARYFNAYDPSIRVIHGPSFHSKYYQHWLAPQETNVAWLGICYAMMTLSLQSYDRAGDEPPEFRGIAMEMSHEFRRLTAQCILLADITLPIAQNLQALVLHLQAESDRSKDAEPGVLLMVSLCVRLAMRMGYHRDPAPHKAITTFQAEMRRRVWAFVRQCDLLSSSQFGLPAMTRTEYTDTAMPANLYDDELHEEMTSLPPSRPQSEATPMSYMIAKSTIVFLLGRIVERVSSIEKPLGYEEVMALDQELRDARSTCPPQLQMQPHQESAHNPANVLMQRLGLEMAYLRTLLTLHRRFVAQGRKNRHFLYSRETCVNASMELLTHQATIHNESQPGGRLRSVKWYISSVTHDFLLAAMLVCVDLYHQSEARRREQDSDTTAIDSHASSPGEQLNPDARTQEMMAAVENCIHIWGAVRDRSLEAYKASTALWIMVRSLKERFHYQRLMQPLAPLQSHQQHEQHNAPQDGLLGETMTGTSAGGLTSNTKRDELAPEQSAAMTLGMLSSGGMSSSAFGAGSAPNDARQPVPLGMTSLLNDAVQPPRTGLTPAPSENFSSTLAALLGTGAGEMNLDGVGDLDWVSTKPPLPPSPTHRFIPVSSFEANAIFFPQGAWDNYIANNTAMNPGNAWGMNLDIDSMGAPTTAMPQNLAPELSQPPQNVIWERS